MHYQNLTTNQQSLTPSPNGPDDDMYAEPYSLNQYAKEPANSQRNTPNEPTYLNSQQLNEPTSANDDEPTYAAVHNTVPNFASVKNSEINFASVKDCVNKSKENALHTPNPTYANLNLIKLNKKKLKSKDPSADDDKSSSRVGKSKKHSDGRKGKGLKKTSPESQKLPEVTYADLSLANASPGKGKEVLWIASIEPKYSEVQQLTNIDHDYENADFKNDSIEPAYCEIVPTKK